ncbi:MJ0042-type zinc finger domain-containing protein [Planctellipticum variicoloris]|uniref:MJ0042-type zinc finger domain-containing protein n=1 Tax=Planctellipticum variicoloris TaxID=3064265 RepID=UPI003013CC29|nr:zinc-ribbon domain-containing protein [Planctomycetaceae bacterium SH412]
MLILTACPNCQKSFRVDSAAVGKNARCGSCGTKFRVTEAQSAPAIPAELPAAEPELADALAGLGQAAAASPPPAPPMMPAFNPPAQTPPQPAVAPLATSQPAPPPTSPASTGSFTFRQTLILVAVFGVVCAVAGVGAWSVLRPRTFVEELKAGPKDPKALAKQIQQQIRANRGIKHFRGKEIPFNGALVVGRRDATADVKAFEDTSSWIPVSGWTQQEYDDRKKKGWIVELPPMLAVKLLESSTSDFFMDGYRYKGNLDFEKKLYHVEILEGPRTGQKWWIHELNLVKDTDDMALQEHMRDPARQEGKTQGERQLDALFGAPGGQ